MRSRIDTNSDGIEDGATANEVEDNAIADMIVMNEPTSNEIRAMKPTSAIRNKLERYGPYDRLQG
jgi:hypothetical protein